MLKGQSDFSFRVRLNRDIIGSGSWVGKLTLSLEYETSWNKIKPTRY